MAQINEIISKSKFLRIYMTLKAKAAADWEKGSVSEGVCYYM